MNQVRPSIQADLFQKGIVSLNVNLKNITCNFKFCTVPSSAASCCESFQPSVSAGPFHIIARHKTLYGFCPRRITTLRRGTYHDSRSNALLDERKMSLDSDLETKLQELFAEVKSMIRMGNKNDALDLLQANYEVVREQMNAGGRGIEEAATLDVIALGYMAIGDFKMVESLMDMLYEVVNCLEDEVSLLDPILTHMGSMYSTLGKFEKSLLSYRRVLDIMERKYGKNSTFLVTPLLGMGKALAYVGRATKAVDAYYRAIAILEYDKGAESEELVVPLYALGNLSIKEGKAVDAENPFMRIVTIYKKLFGERDERVGLALSSLANAKCAKGDVDEAIHLYRSALQILKESKSRALDDNLMEKMRIDLAELLHVVGRENEGRELLEECLSICENCKGKGDPIFATHLMNLATSYSRSKNFAEAERLLRTCLQIIMKTAGPDDPSTTFPMLQLAITLYNLKQDEEAEQLALEALRIREKSFGNESLPVGEALDCLISIRNRSEKNASEVLDMLRRILRIQEKAFGHESEEIIETLKKIVFYMDKLGMKNEKLPFQRRLSVTRNKFKQNVLYR